MRAPISVVVPTLNAASALPGCAAALFEGVQAGLVAELIVTDGGSADDTITIAKELGARVVSGSASRGGQLARGCAKATGNWLLIVHADTQLAPGWTEAAKAHLSTRKAGWGHLQFDRGGQFVASWANFRSRVFGLPYGDQALLLPRRLYEDVGGYPDQPLMEDVAIAKRLKGQMRAVGFTAVTSGEKFRRVGWVRQGARNITLLLRYMLGADAQTLSDAYRKR